MSTVMTYEIRSISSADTERLGENLGRLLKPPAVIELRSDLGGGKTTFVRGLVRGLGSHHKVGSPTFTLVKIYNAKSLEIHHFDFYRLSEPGVVSDQLEESLQNSRVITVIEWSQIVENVLPAERLSIKFEPSGENPDGRTITIKYPSSHVKLIKQLETVLAEPEP